jgi:hypothetical protein
MATAKTGKAKALPRNAGLPADLLEKYKDFPGIKAIERRMLAGDDVGSVDIRLKGEPAFLDDPYGKKRVWYTRWINTKWPGRWAQVTQVLGYEPVRVSEILDLNAITDLFKAPADGADPMVRRGDRGEEILVKYPLELYLATKKAKADLRRRRELNAKVVKEELANNAARALGDEAADMIHDDFQLTLRQRRATLGAELSEQTEVLDEA